MSYQLRYIAPQPACVLYARSTLNLYLPISGSVTSSSVSLYPPDDVSVKSLASVASPLVMPGALCTWSAFAASADDPSAADDARSAGVPDVALTEILAVPLNATPLISAPLIELAGPMKVTAVILLAEKSPLASLATIADAVFALVAVVAELSTFPAVLIVLSLLSAIEPASMAFVTLRFPMVRFTAVVPEPDTSPVKVIVWFPVRYVLVSTTRVPLAAEVFRKPSALKLDRRAMF